MEQPLQTDGSSNPREIIGGNNPPLPKLISEQEGDFALVVTDYLNDQFRDQLALGATLREEARSLPEVIDGDETKGKYTSLIKRIRDHAKALTAFHDREKIPYHRGGQAVDQTFFGEIDKLSRRDKNNRPGAADILNARLTEYDLRVLAEKQAALKREADERDRLAREAREAEEKALREAAEAQAAADRARVPERIEEKREVAETKTDAAVTATVNAQVAAGAAETARVDSLAKPADLMRNRGEDGTLSTMATEPYAIVLDRNKLDYVKLAPFFSITDVEKAVRAWAKNTGHNQQMDGASIGRKPKSIVR